MRELDEEWSVAPEHVQAEALVRLPHGMVMFIGHGVAAGAEVTMDHEHDDVRVVAARRRRLAGRRPTSRCGGWRGSWRESSAPA